MADGTTEHLPATPRKQSDPILGPWLGPSLQDEHERAVTPYDGDQAAEQAADHQPDFPDWVGGLGETER